MWCINIHIPFLERKYYCTFFFFKSKKRRKWNTCVSSNLSTGNFFFSGLEFLVITYPHPLPVSPHVAKFWYQIRCWKCYPAMISADLHYCKNPLGQEVLLCLSLGKQEGCVIGFLMWRSACDVQLSECLRIPFPRRPYASGLEKQFNTCSDLK